MTFPCEMKFDSTQVKNGYIYFDLGCKILLNENGSMMFRTFLIRLKPLVALLSQYKQTQLIDRVKRYEEKDSKYCDTSHNMIGKLRNKRFTINLALPKYDLDLFDKEICEAVSLQNGKPYTTPTTEEFLQTVAKALATGKEAYPKDQFEVHNVDLDNFRANLLKDEETIRITADRIQVYIQEILATVEVLVKPVEGFPTQMQLTIDKASKTFLFLDTPERPVTQWI